MNRFVESGRRRPDGGFGRTHRRRRIGPDGRLPDRRGLRRSPTSRCWTALRDWDASISEELADSRSERFESIAQFFSRLADTPSILAFAAVISIVLALARKWRALAFVPLALVIEIACFGAVNYAVQRPRPDVVKVGSVPSTFSFPSGHVAATVVCWIGAALLLAMFGRPRAGARALRASAP